MNAAALVMAPLTVVQPIGAIALVITTVVNTKDQGLSMNRATVVAISACVTGSALFVVLAVNVTQPQPPGQRLRGTDDRPAAGPRGPGLWRPGGGFPPPPEAIFHILGAGVLFGFVAVLVRTISVALMDPNGLFLCNVRWYTVVAIAAAGRSWDVLRAERLSGGPPDLVIAGLTVIDPMVGIAIGIGILGELRPDVHRHRDLHGAPPWLLSWVLLPFPAPSRRTAQDGSGKAAGTTKGSSGLVAGPHIAVRRPPAATQTTTRSSTRDQVRNHP